MAGHPAEPDGDVDAASRDVGSCDVRSCAVGSGDVRSCAVGSGDAWSGAARRDGGVTFVEVLITIVLMGTVVIGILAATRTAVIASRTAAEAAAVESALLSAAERVERAARADGYTCDLSGPVLAAAQLEFGVSAADAPTYVSIAYRHLAGGEWQDGACPIGSDGQPRFQANLVQRLRITMTSPTSGLSRTLEVLKGDV